MLSIAEASQQNCSSLPALADEISRSLAEVVTLLEAIAPPDEAADVAALADAARRLSEVQGALMIIDQPGLAVLAQLLRTQLLACGNAGTVRPDDVAKAARECQQLMQRVLDGLLYGRRPVAGELMPCWQRLAALGEAGGLHPSALVSLQLDEDVQSLLRTVPAAGLGLEESEPALLALLRAQHDAGRSAAALRIADVITHACAKARDADEHARWLALRAYLIEFAQAGGDPVRAKKIVAGTVRALRHLGEDGAALASLAREALFELAQRELASDDAHEVALLFGLEYQFPAKVEHGPAMSADDDSASQFAEAIVATIGAIEAEPDKLTDAGIWNALAGAAAGDTRFAHAAGWLRDIVSQPDDKAFSRECLAAVLLCLQACVSGGAKAVDTLAGLMKAARDSERLRQMHAWSQALGTHTLMLDLSRTLRAEMLAAEQALDTNGGVEAARMAAVSALTRIGGAMQLLALDEERDAVLALRARLDAADTSVTAFDDATALQWVQLQEFFVLLPWRLRASNANPVTSADEDTSLIVDEGDDSLDAIFIDEAGSLLRELRVHSAAPDHDALMHAAHTLAGCSATVGVAAISALAHAMEEAIARGAEPEPSLLAATFNALDAMLAEFAVSGACSGQPHLVERWQLCMPASPAAELVVQDVDIGDHAIELQLPAPEIAPSNEYVVVETGDETAVQPETMVVPDELPADIQITAASEPEPLPTEEHQDANDAEAELLAIFREEAADLLPQIEQAVRAWQRQPDDREQPATLLRVLHTLKGSARMAGQHALGEDFHHAEAEIGALSQQAAVAVATQLPALLERVDRWLQSVAGAPVPPANEVTPSEDDVLAASPAPQKEAPSPLLRVRADRLAQFADSSAEIWVGNARIREGLQEQRRAVADLSDDLARLRAQLRELEIEAESRILSRAAQGSASDFDPLEFDRYTRLHELTRMMAESITDIAGVQRGLVRQVEALGLAASAQARDLRRQQSELQALRSQPLRSVDGRLRHLLRQAAREAGRDVELFMNGGDVEIERGLLDRLMGPLEHLLRNAVVHGIELPQEREQRGKPREGKVTLAAALAGNELRLTLSDDGRGLDLARIRERALAVGLLHGDATDTRALAALIFEPGFSTASEVTALSGRGIGMDAVRVELQALGGRIDVDSEAGQGCRFSIRLPAAMASVQVILATAGRRRIALPAALLQQVLQLDPAQIKPADDVSVIDWQGNAVRLIRLGQALGDASTPIDEARVPVAVLRDGERVLAVQLDAIDGQREVIIKHPGAQLAQVPGLAGATLLGDGGIALIIDPFRLPASAPLAVAVPEAKRAPLVLVVDDSLTVRRASQRLLERHGYAVALARDGIEALEQLQQQRPAAVLLDIEMPRMDGFELLAALRDDARLRGLPVVMITSRIAERHRERATLLGATAYMGKPYDEEALLGLLSQVCAPEAAAA